MFKIIEIIFSQLINLSQFLRKIKNTKIVKTKIRDIILMVFIKLVGRSYDVNVNKKNKKEIIMKSCILIKINEATPSPIAIL